MGFIAYLKRRFEIVFALTALSLGACQIQPIPVPASPDFAPTKAAAVAASNSAVTTARLVNGIADQYAAHAEDTQPASAFIANTSPTVAAATQAAGETVRATAAITPAVIAVEKQTVKLEANANANFKAAEKYQGKYEDEKSSWFGGKIGHIIWWTLFTVIAGAAIWVITKILMLLSPAGWLTEAATPFTMIGNIFSSVIGGLFRAVAYVTGFVWGGIQSLWDNVLLKHIPWPTVATPQDPVVDPPTAA